ncbi:MAG: lipopolysaccharide kinase InaA family protein, partial [Planctomycetota bacterium]
MRRRAYDAPWAESRMGSSRTATDSVPAGRPPMKECVCSRSSMRELPHTIEIRRIPASADVEEVVCRRVLRSLPGRREVFDASWHGRDAIVKVFAHPFKAKRHVRRERRGLQRLAQLKIGAPAVLFHGRTEDGRWAVVTEKIKGAMSLLEARNAVHKSGQRELLLDLASRELARLHEAGVMQQDFHPGNFLVKNDCLILLDPGQIRFLGRPAGRTASIHQLAHLARILAPDDRPEAIELICSRYAESRRWEWGAAESALFWRFLRRGR